MITCLVKYITLTLESGGFLLIGIRRQSLLIYSHFYLCKLLRFELAAYTGF